jgi:XTP/dITP diphosphohydrolase
MRLVCASANPDKVAEIAAILQPLAIELLPRPPGLPDVLEIGATLLDNARLKAVAVSEASGAPAVADDTGLEVEALDGAPGVFSARYAGENATYEDNVAKLLDALAEIRESAARAARFRTVALLRVPPDRDVWAEGVVRGTIAPAPRGTNGFGYDPVFVPDEGDGRTFAELTADEKHAFSHRGRAFRALAAALRASDLDL